MANYQGVKFPLTDSQITSLKSAIENKTGTSLKFGNEAISQIMNGEGNTTLFLTQTQLNKIEKNAKKNAGMMLKLSAAQVNFLRKVLKEQGKKLTDEEIKGGVSPLLMAAIPSLATGAVDILKGVIGGNKQEGSAIQQARVDQKKTSKSQTTGGSSGSRTGNQISLDKLVRDNGLVVKKKFDNQISTVEDLSPHFKNPEQFKGVFSRNEVNNMEMKHNGDFALINLDDEDGPGTHWVGVKLSRAIPSHPQLLYFDSYNLPPPKNIVKYANKRGFDLISNKDDNYQHVRSSICGWFITQFFNQVNTIGDYQDFISEWGERSPAENELKLEQIYGI